MTAGGDVFSNLIFTQSNRVIVLPQNWTQSTGVNTIQVAKSELCGFLQ